MKKHTTDSFYQLYQQFAVPFDLPAIKLLCLHVSEHRDEAVARPIWNQIFEESSYTSHYRSYPMLTIRHVVMQETDDAKDRADLIMTNVIPLGQRFYPSESSFPLRS